MLTGHSGYDVIVPTAEPTLSRLIAAGALLPLDKTKMPNLAGLDTGLDEAGRHLRSRQQIRRDLSVGHHRPRRDPVQAQAAGRQRAAR